MNLIKQAKLTIKTDVLVSSSRHCKGNENLSVRAKIMQILLRELSRFALQSWF